MPLRQVDRRLRALIAQHYAEQVFSIVLFRLHQNFLFTQFCGFCQPQGLQGAIGRVRIC